MSRVEKHDDQTRALANPPKLRKSANNSGLNDSRGRTRPSFAKAMHEKPIEGPVLTFEDAYAKKIQKNTKLVKNLLVEKPIEGASGIFSTIYQNMKNAFNKIDNADGETEPGLVKMKKLGLGVLSGIFMILGLKGSFDFVKDLWSAKDKKIYYLPKIADVLMKWAMSIGIWNGVVNKQKGSFKFTDLKTIAMGSGISVVLSQILGVVNSQQNALSTVARLTGSEDTLKTAVSDLGITPASRI